jgi:Leucine-rich repeat (LRR) protein
LNIFNEFTNLTHLNLNSNKLTHLNSTLFQNLTNLIVLKLSHNYIDHLPQEIFNQLVNLQELHLSNNQLKFLNSNLFDGLTSLSSLYLRNNNLVSFDENIFTSLTNLQNVFLSGNNFTFINEAALLNLNRLIYVEISSNYSTYMYSFLYNGLFNLQQPVNLTTLYEYLFNRLSDLVDIYSVMFNDLNGVNLLAINATNANSLTAKIIDDLQNYLNLNLSSSIFSNIDANDMPTLVYLYMFSNKDNALDVTYFNPLTYLTILDISSLGLSYLPNDVFNSFTFLTQLYLNDNSFSSLNSTLFNGLNQLQNLDLAKNQLTHLDELIFNGLINLQFLDLSWNKLTYLPAGLFSSLINVQNLYLQNNYLFTFDTNTFYGLNQLNYLNLEFNNITIESQLQLQNAFSNINNTKLIEIYMSGNPFISNITNTQCLCGNNTKCLISPNVSISNDCEYDTKTTTITTTIEQLPCKSHLNIFFITEYLF